MSAAMEPVRLGLVRFWPALLVLAIGVLNPYIGIASAAVAAVFVRRDRPVLIALGVVAVVLVLWIVAFQPVRVGGSTQITG